jgi:hypothetical protein
MAYKYFMQHRKNECTNPQPLNHKNKDPHALTPREQAVVSAKETYGPDGRLPTNGEVAAKLGISKQAVNVAVVRANKKLNRPPPEPEPDGRKKKPATTLDILEGVQKKAVDELKRRVANKENLKNMMIEDVLALIKGAGAAMAQEVNMNNAGAGDDTITFDGPGDIFKVAEGAEPEGVDADQEDREDQPPAA